MSDKDKIEKRMTKRELLAFRRNARVKDLALFEEHERTHTGTAVLRKHQAMNHQYENSLDQPMVPPHHHRSATVEEIKEAVLQSLLLAGTENVSITVACSRIAARYGLAHNQVSSLKDEVLIYLEKVAQEVRRDELVRTDHGKD